jgi:hypothetical protein
MSRARVARVEALRVLAVQPLHARGEIGDGRVRDQVVVGAEHAERDDRPVVLAGDVEEQEEEAAAVEVVAERQGAVYAARPDMEEPVGE